MDRRFLTVLGVSLVFALVVSSIFYQMTSSANGVKKPDPSDKKDIVIAAHPLSVGSTLKAADLTTAKVSSDQFPKGAFSKVEEIIERPVISNILMDEPVLEGRLAPRGSGQGLAPIIPLGMRAVSVRVSDVVGVAGFVLPGLRVDVLVTGRPPDTNGSMTSTVLQNILVLSAGTTIQPDAKGQAINATNVTLLVTPAQAETLTLASSEGRIQLVLRNGGDQIIEKTTGRELAELYGVRKARPRPAGDLPVQSRVRIRPVAALVPAALPPPLPLPDQVVVIRGTQKTVETVAPNRLGGIQ